MEISCGTCRYLTDTPDKKFISTFETTGSKTLETDFKFYAK